VELVGSVWKPSIGGKFPIADGCVLLEEVENFCRESARRDNNIYRPPQRRKEAVWRAPIGDKEFSSDGVSLICRATAKSEEGYQIILKTFKMIEQVRKQGELMARMYNLQMPETQGSRSLPNAGISASESASITSSMTYMSLMGDMQNPSAKSYMAMMGDMRNRRPFMSTQGYVGLGPASIQSGDIICVLLGAKVPYIFRAVDGGGFKLIGEAYCDGIMDGEIMNGTPLKETFIIS
jgi:hypothetical protein